MSEHDHTRADTSSKERKSNPRSHEELEEALKRRTSLRALRGFVVQLLCAIQSPRDGRIALPRPRKKNARNAKNR